MLLNADSDVAEYAIELRGEVIGVKTESQGRTLRYTLEASRSVSNELTGDKSKLLRACDSSEMDGCASEESALEQVLLRGSAILTSACTWRSCSSKRRLEFSASRFEFLLMLATLS
jgi:hypothetical protein